MLQTYDDLLKEYFADKTSFYKSIKSVYGYRRRRYGYGYGQQQKASPSTVIVELDKAKYAFTQNDFNNFIKCATYNKGNSFIVNPNGDDNGENAIEIMFTKFTPSEKQFNTLIACHKDKTDNKKWINVLKEQEFEFTESQKKQLIAIGYDSSILYQAADNLTLDDVKDIIDSIFKCNTRVDIIEDVIATIDIKYPDDFIDVILGVYNVNKSVAQFDDLHYVIEFFVNKKNLKINNSINNILITNKLGFRVNDYLLDKGLQPNQQ